MVTDSELSDQFSIDTVGSHGAIRCKGLKMEYQVSFFCAKETFIYIVSTRYLSFIGVQWFSNSFHVLLIGWCHYKSQQF
jgi:hypothetical protein